MAPRRCDHAGQARQYRPVSRAKHRHTRLWSGLNATLALGMRTITQVSWCDDTDGYHQAPNGDTLNLRCEFHLDDGTVARVAVLHKAVAAVAAACGRALALAELREAAKEFYVSRIEDVPVDAEPAYWFEYNESVDGILAFLPRRNG